MSKVLIAILCLLMTLSACTQRVICPAYQSSFIHDKEALRKKFSYFESDSTPKVFTASATNRYLVAVPESYRKKVRSLQTVEMKRIYPYIPDSLKTYPDVIRDSAAMAADSLAGGTGGGLDPADSAYAITKKKERYNVDQDNYMWYFRDILILPDVRAAMESNKKGKDSDDKGDESDAPKRGFFKRLFKRDKSDSLQVEEATEAPAREAKEDADGESRKEKKRLFKKRDKTKEAAEKPKKSEAKKEEESDDDGF